MSVGSAGVAVAIQKEAKWKSWLNALLSRYFYLCMSLVMAGLVVWGFSRTVNNNLFHADPPRPWLLWLHGAAFSTWILFFIAQSALVRVREVRVHRTLGWFGAALAALMVGLGLRIAVVMTRFNTTILHQQNVASFLAIPFEDMLVFAICIALAIYWRGRPDYHRRMVFIASCCLMDAAVGRFDFVFNHNLFYPALDLLIVLGMLRDWVVEGRVHKVYSYVMPPMILLQGLTIYAWRVNPAWWRSLTDAIIR